MKRQTLTMITVLGVLLALLAPVGPVEAAPPEAPDLIVGGFPFGEPAYDSGWRDISQGEDLTLTHNLGGDTDSYVVDLQGTNASVTAGHSGFGLDTRDSSNTWGIYWSKLTTSDIVVSRASADPINQQVRVRIWVAPTADYDSNWFGMGQDPALLNHGLGGDSDEYLVYLEFQDTSPGGYGVNQMYYGRDRYRDGGDVLRYKGAYWYNLTDQSVQVYRGADTTNAAVLRLRIWRVRAPDYDSGWQAATQGVADTLDHNLGGPWSDFFVDLQFKDTDGSNGVNQRSYGRDGYWTSGGGSLNEYGAYWRSLTGSQITVYRASEDNDADQVRVRIWASRQPKYNSGWRSLDQGFSEKETLIHNLGGDPDTYVVDLQFKDTGTYGINQCNYGLENVYSLAYSEMRGYGAAWLDLTDSQIEIYRAPNDTLADQGRVRIWIAPPADYDSGWRSIGQGASLPLSHSAGTGIVYLEFRDDSITGGVNQMYYGVDRRHDAGSDYEIGAYWRSLDSSSITVYRGADDDWADEVRVRIWYTPDPDYESTLTTITAGATETFTHTLGRSPDNMVVDLRPVWATGPLHKSYGSDSYYDGPTRYDEGAYWREFTSSSIQVVRENDDIYAPNVLVRIWIVEPAHIYLPLILRNYP